MIEKRDKAYTFLTTYVQDEYQLHHAEMVEAAMTAVAKHLDMAATEVEKFALTGLIHDWDYEKWPEEHPGHYETLKSELEWVDDEVIDALKGHADLDFERSTKLAQALLACDEFSGLLYAYMKMVGNYGDMKTKSIRKKVYKDVKFAAKINREDVKTGITELGIPEDEFFELIRDTFAEKYD